MTGSIRNRDALLAIPPAALSAYARSLGWIKLESYGDHSDVYTSELLPEIILPRTQRLGDYANIVSQLIGYFSDAAETDALSLYRDLLTADRDVIRVRTPVDQDKGSVAVDAGIKILTGARDMVLAAACSLSSPQTLYRAGANKEASEYLSRVRLGQTEQGSFVITLLSPAISPPLQESLLPDKALYDGPFERQVTLRLADALSATRNATERTNAGESESFSRAVSVGVSANLCEALVQLIEPFPSLDIRFSWARTYPRVESRDVIRFALSDAPILREAARSFRALGPRPDTSLFGFVSRLTRDQQETEGTISLRASIDKRIQSVTAVLNQMDYNRAIEAHRTKSPIVARGDLERVGQRWHLGNPHIEDVILREDEAE